MDCCIIPPLSALPLMEQGDRIFALSQLWKRSEEYRTFISLQKKKGKFVIMDNGCGDHDTTTTQEELLRICLDLMPDEIIPIDVLYNKEATLYNLQSFVVAMANTNLLGKVGILAVPQGANKAEWMECYEEMANNQQVNTIGLSKITVPYIYGTGTDDQGIMEGRNQCVIELRDKNFLKKPIHCLGAGDPREFFKYREIPEIRSTDSCFSVWAAMNEIEWGKGDFIRIPTPKDYFDLSITIEGVEIAESNIDFLKKVLNS